MKILFVTAIILYSNLLYSQVDRPDYDKVIYDTLGYDSLGQVLYPNGKLFFQIPYKNGKVNGWMEQYHEDGSVSMKKLILEDKVVDGFNVSFHENGVIAQSGYHKDGYQTGKWYSYTKNGEPFKIYIYNKYGTLVKTKQWNDKKKRWQKLGRRGFVY